MTAIERDERDHSVPCRECLRPTWSVNARCESCQQHDDELGARWADEFEAYCRRNDER